MAGETSGGELGQQVQQVLQIVQGLSTQVSHLSSEVSHLSTRMDSMDTRMGKVEGWMERLGAEFIKSREELKDDIRNVRRELQDVRTELKADIQQVRTDLGSEMREGFRQVHGRIDCTNDAMNLMSSGLHKVTTERFQNLEQRVQALETRDPQA